jgi:hypothetical protein
MQTFIDVGIAGIGTRIELGELPPRLCSQLRQHYEQFISPDVDPGVTIRIRIEPGPQFIPLDGCRELQIRTFCEPDGMIRFTSHFEQGWIDRPSREGVLTMRERGNPENFLRVLYAWECLERGGLILHASGVIRDGRSYVFFGPSGAGKTTIARMSCPESNTVLSDDLVILGWDGGVLHAYGVPFRGELLEAPRNNAAAPLAGLYLLSKGENHSISRVSSAEAVARLTAATPFVTTSTQSVKQVLAVCEEVNRAVPVRRLAFAKHPGFWEYLT